MSTTERVTENLNRALGAVMASDPRLYLLGEDVLDPYGGAFKVTKGLSARFPGRVITTPISEGSLMGVANGLALCGDKAVVEIMFSDFVTLAFDQIVNFAAKSVTMYGHHVPMHVVVRCPTGGGRGYGATHSQSLQKHFLGVPGLSVYEISPFHDNSTLLASLLAAGSPAVLFEDKILYGQRMHRDGVVDDLFAYDFLDEAAGTARVHIRGDTAACDCVLIAPGGVAARALAAARSLFLSEEIVCQVVVPTRLHPFDPVPLGTLLARAQLVCVVEDSAPGGCWGAEVAVRLYDHHWAALRRQVELLTAADSIVPSAIHLERRVMPQAAGIHNRILEALRA
jgi:pyruvate/2-oxoglutarate/acetoin dehydrogenase E1 component